MFRGAQVQLNSTLLAAGKGERRNVQCSPFCRVDYFDVPFVARMARLQVLHTICSYPFTESKEYGIPGSPTVDSRGFES